METYTISESMDNNRLKQIFQIDKFKNIYKEYTPLKDTQAGFSVKREYRKNVRYYPPHTEEGKPDRVALFHVVCHQPKNTKDEKSPEKLPIFLSIGLFSRWFENHLDYDFGDKNCPTEESENKSKSTPRPINLQVVDEYVYDNKNNSLQNQKGEVVLGKEVLDMLFEKHCNTVHPIKGFKLRWQLSSKRLSLKLLALLIEICKWKLKFFFGRRLDSDLSSAGVFKPFKKSDMKLVQPVYLNLAGYKAAKPVVITDAIFTLVIFIISYATNIEILKAMFSNSVVTLCFVLVLLSILDNIFPILILGFINCLINLEFKHIFIEFKV